MSYSVSIDPIDTVKPYEKNPRQITPDAIAKVAKSIKKYGFRSPIVVDNDRIILAGHTRLQAAQKLGMKKVPVHVAEGLSESQKISYRLADNRSAEESQWDFPTLIDEMKNLEMFGADLSDTLFDPYQIGSFMGEETNAEEEWQDMPEFDQPDEMSWRKLIVHFRNQDDFDDFVTRVGQKLTDKTKFIWHPVMIKNDLKNSRYKSNET